MPTRTYEHSNRDQRPCSFDCGRFSVPVNMTYRISKYMSNETVTKIFHRLPHLNDDEVEELRSGIQLIVDAHDMMLPVVAIEVSIGMTGDPTRPRVWTVQAGTERYGYHLTGSPTMETLAESDAVDVICEDVFDAMKALKEHVALHSL